MKYLYSIFTIYIDITMYNHRMNDTLYCSKSEHLKDKTIVLCVTGSIAAVETVKLSRELRRHGARVHAVMSEAAQRIITPLSLEFATGNTVVTSIGGHVEHVALAGSVEGCADCIIVCPCTLNTAGKIAQGIADTPPTLVVATALSHIPIIVVPTMHESMWQSAALSASLDTLEKRGVCVIRGDSSEHKVKMPETRKIVEAAMAAVSPHDLAGTRALVTAGATREPIDSIRHITNRSTGKMGAAVAWELYRRGADVTVVAGAGMAEDLPGKVLVAETYEAVRSSVLERDDYDIYVMAMAVSDFSVEQEEGKLSSSTPHILRLTPHGKILPELRARARGIIVGFKAACNVDDHSLVATARDMCESYGIDLVVANDVGKPQRGFCAETNEVYIVGTRGVYRHVPLATKREVASRIVESIIECRTAQGL